MVERLQSQLQALSLDDVVETGKELGRGAYGVVYEVKVSGLICAGKTLHEAIVQVYYIIIQIVTICLSGNHTLLCL